jgi:hypothetical protein
LGTDLGNARAHGAKANNGYFLNGTHKMSILSGYQAMTMTAMPGE